MCCCDGTRRPMEPAIAVTVCLMAAKMFDRSSSLQSEAGRRQYTDSEGLYSQYPRAPLRSVQTLPVGDKLKNHLSRVWLVPQRHYPPQEDPV